MKREYVRPEDVDGIEFAITHLEDVRKERLSRPVCDFTPDQTLAGLEYAVERLQELIPTQEHQS